MEKLIITGNDLTINDVVNVARHGQKVELHPDARKQDKCTAGPCLKRKSLLMR